MKLWWMLLLAAAVLPTGAGWAAPPRILILTGENNHDWRATTSVLKSILEGDGRFVVSVETNVPGMRPDDFAGYDALLSNFNTFGQAHPGPVWAPTMRAAFVDYIRSGHGLVVVHAGSAGFYDWPEFQQIAGATWGPHTEHGGMHTNEIHFRMINHPVTAGLTDFETYDEFWQNAQTAPGAVALATVTPRQEFGGTGKPEPIAFATDLGHGHGFTLLLGHDPRGMASTGFKTLLRRGTEWAATGKVSADEK